MGVVAALVRSYWGSAFPVSHQQAFEEYVAAAALCGSTDTHT